MKNNVSVIIYVMISFLIIMGCVGAVDISGCGVISSTDIYVLTGDIGEGGDCLIVHANNVVINGDGFQINGNVNALREMDSPYTGLVLNDIVVNGSILIYGQSPSDPPEGRDGGAVTIYNSHVGNILAFGSNYPDAGNGGNVMANNSTVGIIDVHGGVSDTYIAPLLGGNGGNIFLDDCNYDRLIADGGYGPAGYGANGTITIYGGCDYDWYCTHMDLCQPDNNQYCSAVIETTSCGIPYYIGDYSEFTTGCDYCTPSWYCSNYTGCQPENVDYCLGYIDSNSCGEYFYGDLNLNCTYCTENWTRYVNPSQCLNGTQEILYSDTNACGTIDFLPADNGTSQTCCVENWLPQLSPSTCKTGTQLLTYYDSNDCGTYIALPSNNGTTKACCVENWIQYLYPSKCSTGTQQILYYDRNSCNTAYFLPSNNGTSQDCNVCTENWRRTVTPTTCLNGTQLVKYTDLNKCRTTDYLPLDNGTMISCCVEDWIMNYGTCIKNKQIIWYTDSNDCGTYVFFPKNNNSVKKCRVNP